MAKFLDMTGKRYGRLTVLGVSKKVQSGKRKRYYWDCVCDCGNSIEVRTDVLTQGMTKSCGCLKKEQDKTNLVANHSHKLSHTKLWDAYYGMIGRCYNPNDYRYADWGGRGIEVCDEWKNDFSAFVAWSYDNGYSKEKTIDRIDNNRNYGPDNCRWTNFKTQSRNRRSNVLVEYNGEFITIVELSEILKIPYKTAYSRYRKLGVKRSDLYK